MRANYLALINAGTYRWASCQIRKIAGANAPGMPATFSPPPMASDPDMRHGTCVTHVPWCMPGSLTIGFLWSRRWGKTFAVFPAHAQPAILRIWQEVHGLVPDCGIPSASAMETLRSCAKQSICQNYLDLFNYLPYMKYDGCIHHLL